MSNEFRAFRVPKHLSVLKHDQKIQCEMTRMAFHAFRVC